jgi:hypothetical protein
VAKDAWLPWRWRRGSKCEGGVAPVAVEAWLLWQRRRGSCCFVGVAPGALEAWLPLRWRRGSNVPTNLGRHLGTHGAKARVLNCRVQAHHLRCIVHAHRLRYEHDVLPGLSHLVLSAPILSSGLAFVGLQVLAGAVSKLVIIPWRKDRSRGLWHWRSLLGSSGACFRVA